MEVLMDPQDLFVLPGGKKISAQLTGVVGPCALAGCTGTIRRFAVPVVNPNTGAKSQHVVTACSDQKCTCGYARASEESVRTLAAELGYDLERNRFAEMVA